MLIESDLFIAYMKKEDWLKLTAEKIINAHKDQNPPRRTGLNRHDP
jgi:hypothetical protein